MRKLLHLKINEVIIPFSFPFHNLRGTCSEASGKIDILNYAENPHDNILKESIFNNASKCKSGDLLKRLRWS